MKRIFQALLLCTLTSCSHCHDHPTTQVYCYVSTRSGGPPLRCVGSLRLEGGGFMGCITAEGQYFRILREQYLSENCRRE